MILPDFNGSTSEATAAIIRKADIWNSRKLFLILKYSKINQL